MAIIWIRKDCRPQEPEEAEAVEEIEDEQQETITQEKYDEH